MLLALLTAVTGPSDSELVRRFKEGDRKAYAEIVRRYQHRVFTLCLRWMGDDQVAREVSQDVFLALFKSLSKFRGDAQLSTWIYRVVVNHCKNRKLYRQRRHANRHEPLEGDRDDEDSPRRQIAADGPGSDASVHRTEAEGILREALAEMDEEQRRIIVLRDVEELSYEEISELLDLPRGTVKSRLHRARAQLAKALGRRVVMEDVL